LSEANELAAPNLRDILDVFSSAASRYKQEYEKMPVLIIDNANRIANDELDKIQDYAKHASDRRIATVVFVSSDGHVPRRMMGN